DNLFEIKSTFVNTFTLLLSPEEIDFNRPVEVRINDQTVLNETVSQSAETLLKWAARDLDRSMLFTAELNLVTPD
ncbi:MAG: hypothetical protein WD772_03075, partial [Pseudohongiellaceae bacterium]